MSSDEKSDASKKTRAYVFVISVLRLYKISIMKRLILCVLGLLSAFFYVVAQSFSASSNLEVFPETDRSLYYSVSDSGQYLPLVWGLDLAWLSEANVRRGVAFMGNKNVDIIRSSFTPTAPLEEGELPTYELGRLNERLDIIALLGRPMDLVINCDHPSVDDWYKGNAANWAALIDVTKRLHEEAGHQVVTVSPFNEPDYSGTGQGTVSDFYNVASELRKNVAFDSIRISGGNTLNVDQALVWYDPLKNRLDEGNTHQLAGSFDSYANFYETVRANGDHATNDELHNVMEAMVGVEYGMQTGIWWGTAEYTRSEFVKASDGRRLAYGEHRDNWTAASVYRHPEGKVQGFVGSSERQAVTTSYRFVSKDKDVFYNGHGPQREFVVEVPGGTGYQQGQSNAEGLVNITWGDDIQPIVDGNYQIMNKHSHLLMEVAGGALNGGANIAQGTSKKVAYQQWSVTPVDLRIGGDFNYFSIINAKSGKSLDILNWSLDNGGNIIQWDDVKGSNQQWYLEYAGDGWFYIRSRYSALCLEVLGNSTASGANIQQSELDGGNNQLWRFIPVDATVEMNQPDAPSGLLAQTRSASVHLQWDANTESDLSGYTILRSLKSDESYCVIAQNVTSTTFVDNKVEAGIEYFYTIKAVDKALNSSAYSSVVSAIAPTDKCLSARYSFENNTYDITHNIAHAKPCGSCSYVESREGSQALKLDGDNAFLKLPSDIIKRNEMAISTWVKWNNGATWSRIFDFGNDQEQYVYLTPRMRFVIKDGGSEQRLDAPRLTKGEWTHVVLTIDTSAVSIYVDGTLVAESKSITINPFDFKPGVNYIGRSQLSTSLFDGCIDDFVIYNYALSSEEVKEVFTNGELSRIPHASVLQDVKMWPIPSADIVNVSCHQVASNVNVVIYDLKGRVVFQDCILPSAIQKIDISHLPRGIYPVKLSMGDGCEIRKIIKK